VFSVALPLALAAFVPTLSVSSVASGAAIAVCFAPEEDCAAFAIHAIDNAEREILVGAYALTTGSGIVEALMRAKERGADVRVIADKTTLRAHERDRAPGRRGGAGLDRRSGADCARRDVIFG
jgi:phosphatidylserine/phosphatidylglycerophosphate/cardiolipin synthase-like enzyme